MHIVPTGQSEFHNGHEVGRYGRDTDSGDAVFVWYHSGLRGNEQPTWAMETDVEWKISISVDTIFVVDDEMGLFAIDRDGMTHDDRRITIDGIEQYLIQADDHCVKNLPLDPTDALRGRLWIESGNEVDENYHQEQGH